MIFASRPATVMIAISVRPRDPFTVYLSSLVAILTVRRTHSLLLNYMFWTVEQVLTPT